jgi:peroxiredoxin
MKRTSNWLPWAGFLLSLVAFASYLLFFYDVARPAEFLVDPSGTVRWVNLTGDFRVRARPDEMLAAARALR